jgi:hypothetical protein
VAFDYSELAKIDCYLKYQTNSPRVAEARPTQFKDIPDPLLRMKVRALL